VIDDGLAREAREVARALGRPLAPRETFDARAYDPAVLTRVVARWRERVALEHRSSTVFTSLALELYEADAPLDAEVVMLRMAQDEVRHAALGAEVVATLVGRAEPAPFVRHAPTPVPRHPGASAVESALRNVVYTTCLSELVACGRLVAALEGMTDPYLRAATIALLADERRHGQFGFLFLERVRGTWLADRALVASLERWLTRAFVVLERELCPAPRPPRAPHPDEARLGLESAELAREVFTLTVREAIVPGLERQGIAAGDAWRGRSLPA